MFYKYKNKYKKEYKLLTNNKMNTINIINSSDAISIVVEQFILILLFLLLARDTNQGVWEYLAVQILNLVARFKKYEYVFLKICYDASKKKYYNIFLAIFTAVFILISIEIYYIVYFKVKYWYNYYEVFCKIMFSEDPFPVQILLVVLFLIHLLLYLLVTIVLILRLLVIIYLPEYVQNKKK